MRTVSIIGLKGNPAGATVEPLFLLAFFGLAIWLIILQQPRAGGKAG
jgi:hypothetical protein